VKRPLLTAWLVAGAYYAYVLGAQPGTAARVACLLGLAVAGGAVGRPGPARLAGALAAGFVLFELAAPAASVLFAGDAPSVPSAIAFVAARAPWLAAAIAAASGCAVLLIDRRVLAMLVPTLGIIAGAAYGADRLLGHLDPRATLPPDGVRDGVRYTWGHAVVNNRFGFREREFATPAPPGTRRVMVLGDSLTWGAGLAPEERYTAVAERLLNADPATGPVEVLNFGIEGGPLVRYYAALRDMLPLVQPDLVVVGFCLNDTQPRSQDFSVERHAFERRARAWLEPAGAALADLGLARLGAALEPAVLALAERAGAFPPWWVALKRTYEPQSREWRDFTAALAGIKALSDAAGLPAPVFAVLNGGVYLDRPTDYDHPDSLLAFELDMYHQAQAAAHALGYADYNHERDLATRLRGQVLALNRVDGHPTAAMNRVYGERLAAAVRDALQAGPGRTGGPGGPGGPGG